MEDHGLVMKDIKRPFKDIPAVEETDETDCDIETKDNNETCEKEKTTNEHVQKKQQPSPVESLRKLSRISHHVEPNSFYSSPSHHSSPNFRRNNSVRSLKNYSHLMSELNHNKPASSESGSQTYKVPQADAASLRSWASVVMGSTDGKKMIVRRVPTSPVELFNIVNPPT